MRSLRRPSQRYRDELEMGTRRAQDLTRTTPAALDRRDAGHQVLVSGMPAPARRVHLRKILHAGLRRLRYTLKQYSLTQ